MKKASSRKPTKGKQKAGDIDLQYVVSICGPDPKAPRKVKISPDWRGRDDGYDKDTVRYYEKVYKNWYFYELYVLINRRKARIVVTDHGVSMDFKTSGECVMTWIEPKKVWPKAKRLQWKQLYFLIKMIEKVGFDEGQRFTRKQMNDLHDQWVNLGKP